MAKLPENFVKPSGATPAARGSRSPRRSARDKRSKLALEKVTAEHSRDILVRLSPEEHEALDAACAALRAIGHEISVEEMIRQVIARWIAATHAACAVDRAPVGALPEPARQSILSQLRSLAERPLRRWRELTFALRRLSRTVVGSGAA
jgi:hypothetical protein